MKTKALIFPLLFVMFMSSCSKRITYSSEFIAKTSGQYLYNQDDIIEIFYEDNSLFLKWRGAEKIKPVILAENEFFVPDMYKKFHFVQHPETEKGYLSIINKDDTSKISYDYLKVEPGYKTPSMHLKDNEYDEALEAYRVIQKEDSTSALIVESDFNRLGYELIRKKEYQNAISVFQINAALHPESENVYDSLADAYLKSGDSLNAFTNYTKALERNTGNSRAKKYIKVYNNANH